MTEQSTQVSSSSPPPHTAAPKAYRPDTLPAFAKNHPFIPFMVGVAFVGFFVSFPEIDLWVQKLAWDETTGFAAKREGFWGVLYTSVPRLAWGITLGALLLLIWGEFRKQYMWGIDRKAVTYLLTTLAIGPGLVVNAIFKEHWGRARPSQITEFGGEAMFTPPFARVAECASNCSFVSGHASMGFYLVAIAFLFTGPKRKLLITIALAYGTVVGMGRVAQGGHFFSDVLFSGLFTITISAMLYHYMLHRDYLGRLSFMTPKWRKPDLS